TPRFRRRAFHVHACSREWDVHAQGDQWVGHRERRQRQCQRERGQRLQLERDQRGGVDYDQQQRQRQRYGQLLGGGERWHQSTQRNVERRGPDLHGDRKSVV